MKVDFERIEIKHIDNFKGGEGVFSVKMFDDKTNKIMHGTLQPGNSIGLHEHTDGSEIIYILSGSGKALFDATEEKVFAGCVHYCPKGHVHSLINDGTEALVFFAVVAKQ